KDLDPNCLARPNCHPLPVGPRDLHAAGFTLHLLSQVAHDHVGPRFHDLGELEGPLVPWRVSLDVEVPHSLATPDRLGLWPVARGHGFHLRIPVRPKGGPVTTINDLHPLPHPRHVPVRNNDHLAVKCLVLLCARADLALSAPRRWPQGCHWPCPFSSVGVRTKSSWPLLRNTRSPSPFHRSFVT